QEMQAAGLNDSNQKYLTWVDDDMYCGIATIRRDDRHDPYVNYNDQGFSYSRIDTPCWGNGNSVELHELFHNLGAVQSSAPHATGMGHCNDEYDVMCYDDGNGPMSFVCPENQEALLDCNNDDYFASKPADGSYLAAHWNTFNSSFLFSTVPANTIAPTAPTGLVGTATAKGVLLNWTPSSDDEGKTVTYKIFRNQKDERPTLLTTATAATYLDATAKVGNTYSYFVVAYDPDNNASEQSNVVTVSIPTTPLPLPDTTPPPSLTPSASNIATRGFTLSWNLPTDKSDIKTIIILLNNNPWATLTNTPSSYNHCCDLNPDTSYSVRLKTVDAAGNASLGNTITVKTLALPTTPASNVPYNLSIAQIDGAEVTVSAKIDTTSGAYFYRLTATGESHSIDYFLSAHSSTFTQSFVDPQAHPQNVTGYYIAVFNSVSQEIGRSATVPLVYSGSSESNIPSTPTNLRLSGTTANSTLLLWDGSTDDSGKVYQYRIAKTDNTAGGTTNPTGGYATNAGLYSMQSGHSYTVTVRAEDIWGNLSNAGSYTFTFP
ncbi:MAG TPA: fibronectin type III domain-containing protein, partial [Ktedonobacteraceae bacterium]|nr:fibronectin type III domain-containing protein [Ktedonobacteraceae bacterium]